MTIGLNPEFRPGHKSYYGNNVTTVFPIDFYFLDDDKNLRVYIVNDETDAVQFLRLDVDYTVTINKGKEGNITTTLEAPISPGFILNIESNVEATQKTTYKYGGKYSSVVVEFVLDKLTLLTQQLYDKSKLAIRQPDTESPLGSMILPPPSNRANRYITFDNDGKLTMVTSVEGGSILISNYWKDIVVLPSQQSSLQTLLPQDAQIGGSTWYVSKTGDDTNDGRNSQTPLKTITVALAYANILAAENSPATVWVMDTQEYGVDEDTYLVLNQYVRLIAPHAVRINMNFNLKDNSHLMSYRSPYSITKDEGDGSATCEITFYDPLLGTTLVSKNECTSGSLTFKINKIDIRTGNLSFPLFTADNGGTIVADLEEVKLADYVHLFKADHNSKIIGSVKSATSDNNSIFVSANNGSKISLRGNEIDMGGGYLYNIDDEGTLGTFVTIVANKVTGQRIAANGAIANVVTASTALVTDETRVMTAGQLMASHDLGEINTGTLTPWIENGNKQHVHIGGSFTLALPGDSQQGDVVIDTQNLFGGAVIDLSAYGARVEGNYDSSNGAINKFIIDKGRYATYLNILNY